MRKLHLIWYMFVPLFLQSVNAQDTTRTDSTISVRDDIKDEPVVNNFEENLDSLLNLWHIQQAIDSDTTNMVDILEQDTIVPEFPDSVYIERLSRIPSVVELSFNRIVRNYIEAYTKKRREQVGIMLGLADYYFPIFDDIFDYYDVPNEMKYMAIIESALNPRALSRARAVGLWQFMYGTGKLYGLTVNSYVDERRDPIKSTHAAARFARDLYRIYGDWILVIAAYNCGPGNVNKAIRRSGGKRNYWDIYYYLPRETRGHVPAYIAATYVMHYYKEHNLKPKPVNLPLATDTIMINEDLHLEQVSNVLGIPLEMLRDMNPQYRRDIIPGKSMSLALKIPVEETSNFIDLQDSIFTYNDTIYFNPNKVVSPAAYTSAGYVPNPPTKNHTKLTYTVKPGDNVGFIASWYGVRQSDLRYWNNIRRNLIRAGQKLTIYVHKGKADALSKIDAMSFAEKQQMVGTTVASNTAKPVSSGSDLGDDYTEYTVRSGDTLWEIARKYPDISDADIMRWNGINYGESIRPGQKLKIKNIN
ncbi:MAG: transglycosylase SLT domain-containing protein [Bacteroidota bacterium]